MLRYRTIVVRAASPLALAALAACGGGGASLPAQGGASAAAPLQPQSATRVAVSITFPASAGSTGASAAASRAAGAGAARKPDYVSPSIASLTIAVDGAAPAVVNAPAPTGSPQTVTTTLAVAPGTHAFVLAEYGAANGGGDLLGRVTQSATVVAGVLNTLPFTLDGQLASIVIQAPANDPFVEGTLASGVTLVGDGPQTFVAVPQDARGNTIVTPGRLPQITVASADGTKIVATAGTGNAFTLQAPAPTGFVAITASGTNLDGKTVTSAPFEAKAVAAFYVADYTVQLVRVFDESGTPLALPPTAFPGLTNPEGLAYRPATAGAAGSIVVTETSNPGYPQVAAFDEAGNAQTLPSGAFSGLMRPLFLTYATPGGTGRYFVPDFFTNSLAEFDAAGAPVPLASGSFPNMINPVSAAYDAHDGEVYVTNGGADTMTAYSATGAPMGSTTVGSHPMGAVYDPNDDGIYMTFGGTLGATTDKQQAQLPGITEYTEALTAVTNPGGFANTSATALFTGIALDPYTKQLYVADAGDSVIQAYTEAGLPVMLPTGAFSTISATTSPRADPMAILFVP